jgi:glutathionylspermidine synthase
MRRVATSPRPDWQKKVESCGLIFHTEESHPYWNESAYYEFTEPEVKQLEDASNELHQLCYQAVDWVIGNDRFDLFQIPEYVVPAIRKAWETEPPCLYGRFDFVFNGLGPPKLLEYNADTPTSLLEAAVVQWKWLEEFEPNVDQFNSIWEGLVEQWQWLVREEKLASRFVHFAHCDLWEDQLTVAVLEDTARQVGLETGSLLMSDIGWDSERQYFVDVNRLRMATVFKLYPWEWMAREEFGQFAVASLERTQWIEPIWKMLLSNKALLAVLWQLFPDCPYLLPAYLDGPNGMTRFVTKPILGREGQGVEITIDGERIATSSDTVPSIASPTSQIYQLYSEVPNFDGHHPIVGSWMIGEDARGIGIRETNGLITDNLARFVPHLFR